MFAKQTGPWLDASGPDSEVVVSTRIRLARNLEGMLFPGRAGNDEQQRVVDCCREAISRLSIFSVDSFRTSHELRPLDLEYLVERHLVSPDFAASKVTARAVFVSQDETVSIMINEEDHLRMQVLASGFDSLPALRELQGLDAALGACLRYAFSPELGFLTACPTNVGTGMRASVLIHLPGLVLTKEIEKILRAALQVGIAVRGLFGEGTETRGNLFQVSNQVTLGKSEEEIIEELGKTTREIISYERRAREYLLKNLRLELEDKVLRAEAILRCARLLTTNEATNLLGLIRLGRAVGILNQPELATINELLVLSRPANLQFWFEREMTPQERDAARAELIRNRLKSAGIANGQRTGSS